MDFSHSRVGPETTSSWQRVRDQKEGANKYFRMSGVYSYGLYSVAVFTRIDVARIDVLDLSLKALYITN